MLGGGIGADILVRDPPNHVVAAIDANAQRFGLSRNEYLRRQLGTEARPHATVTVADLRRSAHVFADVSSPNVMSGGAEGLRPASKTSPTWLIDKSAYARIGRGPDDQVWADRIDRGLVRITTLTRLELGYSARTAADWRAELDVPPLPPCGCSTSRRPSKIVPSRSRSFSPTAASTGAPSIPDLIVAATAELAGLIVLHFDKDFHLIDEVTGQPVERLAVDGGSP